MFEKTTKSMGRAMERKEIADLVIKSLREVLSQRDEQEQLRHNTLDEATSLIGRNSVLDSLGLVNLIVSVEQKLSEDHDIAVTIADERAMSQEKSPFRTVGSVTDYIALLIQEQRNAAS